MQQTIIINTSVILSRGAAAASIVLMSEKSSQRKSKSPAPDRRTREGDHSTAPPRRERKKSRSPPAKSGLLASQGHRFLDDLHITHSIRDGRQVAACILYLREAVCPKPCDGQQELMILGNVHSCQTGFSLPTLFRQLFLLRVNAATLERTKAGLYLNELVQHCVHPAFVPLLPAALRLLAHWRALVACEKAAERALRRFTKAEAGMTRQLKLDFLEAVQQGDLATVSALVEGRASPDCSVEWGLTAVRAAVRHNHADILESVKMRVSVMHPRMHARAPPPTHNMQPHI
jgi:hypothetical protein